MSTVASRALTMLEDYKKSNAALVRLRMAHGDEHRRDLLGTMAWLNCASTISTCEVLWITSDMMRVLRHAAASLPLYAFSVSILPWRNAIAFSETPFGAIAGDDIIGVQWAGDGAAWALGSIYRDKANKLVGPRGLTIVREGNRIESVPNDPTTDVRDGDLSWLAPIFCTLWLLLRQRIAVKHVERADRASRRRADREGRQEPPSVTVIELRRPVDSGASEGAHHDVDWSHRWMVGGHWRNQFHPSDGSHVPTWIAPYVKGPEDKPLVVKDRVFAWTR